MFTIRTILYPTDFSEQSRPAFELACSLARDYGATLVVQHVFQLPLLVPIDGVLMPTPVESMDQCRSRLDQLRPTDPRVTVRHRLTEGDPAEEILKAIAGEKADLVVIGTHGRGGLTRFLVGSVAEAVLRKAPCPVLTVRAPLPDTAAAPPAVEHAGAWCD
jgi:nucleotide-binding universal stress UspA family protein